MASYTDDEPNTLVVLLTFQSTHFLLSVLFKATSTAHEACYFTSLLLKNVAYKVSEKVTDSS